MAYAKANPGKLNYGSAGNGTLQHLSTGLFLRAMNIQALQVPYKGVGAALPDLFSGRTHIMMSSLSALTPHVRAKSLMALAITSRERNPVLPDLPTLDESGVPGYEVMQWQGMLITAGTPTAIIKRLHREIVLTMKQPELARHFAADGTNSASQYSGKFQHCSGHRT